ncbi:hypothetical protein LCGC14_0805290 [marine sediment metagenome]|uniref:Uncharacterized protein n=1 Tax=marine sediment metagenome TaxID=412755 RepID=A0A0F9PSW5_9ZZZZ
MEALEPLALLTGFAFSAINVFKLVRQDKAQLEHYAVFVFVFLMAAATEINLFTLSGIEGSGVAFDYVSYLVTAIIGVPVAGLIHDGEKIVRLVSNGKI